MTLAIERRPRVEHPNPNYSFYAVGDRVLIVASVLGHQGETGTIVAIDTSWRLFPLVVEFRNGIKQHHSAASLRWLEGGA